MPLHPFIAGAEAICSLPIRSLFTPIRPAQEWIAIHSAIASPTAFEVVADLLRFTRDCAMIERGDIE